MNYSTRWKLSTIPDDALNSEYSRRRASQRTVFRGGRKISCDCGKCRTCKAREAKRRERLKVQAAE